MKTCPECAEEVQGDAKVCRFCGHRFDGKSRVAQSAGRKPLGCGGAVAICILALVGAVWAVGDGTDEPVVDRPVVAIAVSPAQQRKLNASSRAMLGTDALVQHVTMRRVVRSVGEQCSTVSEIGYFGSNRGSDMWRVTCADSGDWLVKIDTDDSTTVLSCAVFRQLGSDCRKPE